MFGRKILFLAAWYVAGNVVSSVYNGSKNTGKSIKAKTDPKILAKKFITTQKNFISDMEKRYVSDENKDKLEQKKKQFAEVSEKYLQQWEKLISDIASSETYSKTKKSFFEFIESGFSTLKNAMNSEDEVKTKKKTVKQK